jgi:hypothetical protein
LGIAISNIHIVDIEVSIVSAADTKRSGVGMEEVCAGIADEGTIGNDLVEELGWAVYGVASSILPGASSLRCAVVTPSPRSRPMTMSEKNSRYR